eukprot:COSAG02_NODE_29_length_51136_cov_346.293317_1_plen_164_part_00
MPKGALDSGRGAGGDDMSHFAVDGSNGLHPSVSPAVLAVRRPGPRRRVRCGTRWRRCGRHNRTAVPLERLPSCLRCSSRLCPGAGRLGAIQSAPMGGASIIGHNRYLFFCSINSWLCWRRRRPLPLLRLRAERLGAPLYLQGRAAPHRPAHRGLPAVHLALST